ncbi:TonB-dependent receptor [Helicobacter sp. 13S00477-4]|uniref:TonB-dependent receptor domain-containing protein n=1 Tax=Helicobacter sp. 13S00477-4 TaxID=1905759 RepID=UPI000BA50CCF|nr:TonB-dependent receptor [Helicobacter sp. 13S00477-4]PAF50643.1 hypothetical protein BKH44_07310 [Helicobacter sp. 13S00477-4]
MDYPILKYKILLAFGLLFSINMLSKATNQEPKDYILKKSVVSASGFLQDFNQAPASIDLLTPEQLADSPYRDLGEAISLIPGVSTNQEITGATGYTISIRGMPPQYTLILVDGKRQNITPAAFPNAYDSIFSSFMPPLGAIERIEVIKGPMSTLYGSDAIGGIINIITKKNFTSWHTNIDLSTTIQEDSAFGNLYNIGFWLSGPLDKDKRWGLSLRGRESYRAFVSAKDLTIIPTPSGIEKEVGRTMIVGGMESNVYDIGGRISYSPSEENYLYFDYDRSSQWLNKYPGTGAYASPANPQTFTRNNYIFTHLGDYAFGKTDSSIQYNSTDYKGRFIPKTKSDRGLAGNDFLVNTKLSLPIGMNQVTLGGEYWFSSLNDNIFKQTLKTNFIYQNNISLFAENELPITQNLILTLGMRENYNFSFGFNTSPRAYLVYNITDYLTFKGGFSTGYKVPTPAQLVAGPNGISGTSSITRILYGNPNLKPESSLNFEISTLIQTDWFDSTLTGFYNKFNDKIIDGKEGKKLNVGDNLPIDNLTCSTKGFSTSGITNCFYPINIDEAITYGTEVTLSLHPINIAIGKIGFNINYAFTKTKQTKGKDKGKPLINIPEHNLNASLNYFFRDLLSLYLRTEFYAKQPKSGPGWLLTSDYGVFNYDQLKKAYPSLNPYFNNYFLFHVGGSYQITKTFKAHFGIYNLLNEKFSDWINVKEGSSTTQVNNFNYIHEGRRYFISLNMDF